MKKLILFILSITYSIPLLCQTVETSKGGSAILDNLGYFSLNLVETDLKLKYTNYDPTNNSSLVYGGSISGKNKEGITGLFNSGTLNLSSRLDGYFGVQFNNYKNAQSDYNKLVSNLTEGSSKELRMAYIALLLSKIQNSVSLDTNSNEVKTFIGALRKSIDSSPINGKIKLNEKLIEILKNEKANNAKTEIKNAAESGISLLMNDKDLNNLWTEITSVQNSINAVNEKYISEVLKQKSFFRVLVFVHGGINADDYEIYDSTTNIDLTKHFKTEHFRGGQYGIGANFRFGGEWVAGVKYTFQETNNTELLKAGSYKYTITDTSKQAILSKTKDYSSYDKTKYAKVKLNKVDFDIMRYINLPIDSQTLILDLYSRTILSDNIDFYPSTTSLGLSGAVFKKGANFIGGLYIEQPDIFRQIDTDAKQDGLQPDERDDLQRLSFGAYTKFSFQSLLQLL